MTETSFIFVPSDGTKEKIFLLEEVQDLKKHLEEDPEGTWHAQVKIPDKTREHMIMVTALLIAAGLIGHPETEMRSMLATEALHLEFNK